MFNPSCKKNWQFKKLESLADEFLKGHLTCSYAPIYNYYTRYDNGQLLPYQVFGFVVSVLKRVLPNDFIKNRAFMKNFREKLWIFLKISRFEKMSVNELIHGLKIKEILPIFDSKAVQEAKAKNTMTMPQSEHEKIKWFIKSFMHFLFENFIVDLLRSNFYITEAAGSRSRLVFYRHDTWNRLTEPVLETLKDNLFQPITTTDSKQVKARCRLVPKDTGKFRPIMAFRKPPSTVNKDKDLNYNFTFV
jgi:telomerase reverse transcriptase